MVKDRRISQLIDYISEECGVLIKDVEEVEDWLYEFIRMNITCHDFSNMNLEEFRNAKKNFNIPKLGKFYASESIFKKINKIK